MYVTDAGCTFALLQFTHRRFDLNVAAAMAGEQSQGSPMCGYFFHIKDGQSVMS